MPADHPQPAEITELTGDLPRQRSLSAVQLDDIPLELTAWLCPTGLHDYCQYNAEHRPRVESGLTG